MLTGCTVDDFKVQIGNATCNSIEVTQNHLKCQPPIEQPSQKAEGHVIAGAVQVVVSIDS